MDSSSKQFKDDVIATLGVNGFVCDIDDHSSLHAFLITEDMFRDYLFRDLFQYFLEDKADKYSIRLENLIWKETGAYDYNWCGSRCCTDILSYHVSFTLLYSLAEPQVKTPVCVKNWFNPPVKIVSIEYDSLKPAGSRIAYHTTEYHAITDMNQEEELVEAAKAKLYEFKHLSRQ